MKLQEQTDGTFLRFSIYLFHEVIVEFAGVVGRRDDAIAMAALDAVENLMHDRLGTDHAGVAAGDVLGIDAARRNGLRHQYLSSLAAARSAVDNLGHI